MRQHRLHRIFEPASVAVRDDGTPEASLKAVTRYVADPGGEACEFALAVADDLQRQGIGAEIMLVRRPLV